MSFQTNHLKEEKSKFFIGKNFHYCSKNNQNIS